MMIGACRDTSGGWADYFIAHGSQLRPIPQDMESEQAIFAPEFSRALRAVLQHPPASGDRVIIVGAGSLGLLTLLALRNLGRFERVMVVADNSFEAEIARKFSDAEIVVSQGPGSAYEAVAEFVQGSVRYPEVGKLTLQGGADLVFETTGLTEHMEDALRFTREGKKLVLMGVNQPWGFNMTPLWYKDVEIRGSVFSGRESHNGEFTETFDIAMDMIEADTIPYKEMITHRFTLSEFAKAFDVLADRDLSQAIKVIFHHVV
jgi:threonine dehydrogenase-like Zn-dependent dehydrogenase